MTKAKRHGLLSAKALAILQELAIAVAVGLAGAGLALLLVPSNDRW